MATHELTLKTTTGRTLYAYPEANSLADWTTHRVALTEASAPNLGRYAFTLDDSKGTLWGIFEGASQPADWSAALWDVDLAAELNRKLAEADQILELSSGRYVLKTYERGTTTELITAKDAKQPNGADLTDAVSQLLAGYKEPSS